MNYRHAYHAGNFADVVKHVILTRVIAYLQRKDAACFVMDTHAGIGRYDLASVEAKKTLEADSGIQRFMKALPGANKAERVLLEPYSTVLREMNPNNAVRHIPGSPEIIARMRRRQDRCVFNELHPEDHQTLDVHHGAAGKKVEVTNLDAWIALRAKLPPFERRGLVLIDPPFEKPSEVDDLLGGLHDALKRFATGTYLVWYPLKDTSARRQLLDGVSALSPKSALDTALFLQREAHGVFAGSGMVIINPPYVLRDELRTLLPFLLAAMADDPARGKWATDWIVETA
ncbi:MAG: 23S rRNA (adenine(2030)-N(6))-methyltransferase RlmJ [Pseudomonadota bacterium]